MITIVSTPFSGLQCYQSFECETKIVIQGTYEAYCNTVVYEVEDGQSLPFDLAIEFSPTV